MLKNNKKHPKTSVFGWKYPTQWDDEAKNSEKIKIFKAFLVWTKP